MIWRRERVRRSIKTMRRQKRSDLVWDLLALEDTELLTQDADPGGTTLIDSRNGFNKLILLEMLWKLCHLWTAGVRFAFNCYRNWAQILLCQPGDAQIILLSREGGHSG